MNRSLKKNTTKNEEVSAQAVRKAIEMIPDKVTLMNESGLFSVEIDGNLLKSLDKFLLLSAGRISEVVTKQRPCESMDIVRINRKGEEMEPAPKLLNTGLNLSVTVNSYQGEEVAVFEIKTLKRKDHVVRSIALPMSSKYEPWTKQIVDEWASFGNENPWDISRQQAWGANRIVFDGLEYKVGSNLKPLANHGLRHIRIKELIQYYNFTPLEVQRYVGWTAGSLSGFGVNPLMDTYFSLVWYDYFPKLLKERKTK